MGSLRESGLTGHTVSDASCMPGRGMRPCFGVPPRHRLAVANLGGYSLGISYSDQQYGMEFSGHPLVLLEIPSVNDADVKAALGECYGFGNWKMIPAIIPTS